MDIWNDTSLAARQLIYRREQKINAIASAPIRRHPNFALKNLIRIKLTPLSRGRFWKSSSPAVFNRVYSIYKVHSLNGGRDFAYELADAKTGTPVKGRFAENLLANAENGQHSR